MVAPQRAEDRLRGKVQPVSSPRASEKYRELLMTVGRAEAPGAGSATVVAVTAKPDKGRPRNPPPTTDRGKEVQAARAAPLPPLPTQPGQDAQGAQPPRSACSTGPRTRSVGPGLTLPTADRQLIETALWRR